MSEVYADILNSLTSGLYNEVNYAVREYIQNSYDAIKDAIRSGLPEPEESYHIAINITKDNRIVTISDNGIGMNEGLLNEYTSIGGGTKTDPELTGFRGIGKLSGLRFFEKFVIRTKMAGSVSGYELSWDCGNMMKMLSKRPEDTKRIPYTKFIKDFYTITEVKGEDKDKHYTHIQLINVVDAFKDQVSTDKIGDFIKSNCPVPYIQEFQYANDIINNVGDDLFFVNVFLNDDRIICQYYENKYGLVPPFFRIIKYRDKIRAKVWFSWVRDKAENIESAEIEGIKFRCKGICVGDKNLFVKHCMPPGRGEKSKWFTGEVVVLDENVLPNTARDRFNEGDDSKALYDSLKKEVGKELSLIADMRSTLSAAKQDVEKLVKAQKKGESINAAASKAIDARIKELMRYRDKGTKYGLDFDVVSELETLKKGAEIKVIEKVRTISDEVDETIAKGDRGALVRKLIELKDEEAQAPTKTSRKEFEKPIKKIIEVITDKGDDRAVKSDTGNAENDKELTGESVIRLLIRYLNKIGISYDEKDVRSFVMKEINNV